ncbi:ATP-binding protein [Streptomyces sp. NBS 14/10]|uniref:ATP-binding protein n=1 Tax=Streptomyces sp. NBS 14/10 TaxID=1945643 RepID=UPI000B7D01FB|nr:ATP-binding protein [Streptomyces sp. NBS 14/10]KAK1179020.1 ATP-binding protein [Streptomyces sp. NBS 14/10]NUS87093.1 sensor histidine kinase [Streptomyces sp.]
MLSETAGVIAVASALLVLTLLLGSLWVARLRTALAEARTTAERERAAAAEARAEAERERAVAAERGEEVARLSAVRAELDEAARRERNLRDSVQASFESVARNMHAMAVVQQQVLDGLEQRISEAALMAEVMKADHAAAQMTRKAQTLMVMCGIWPARRETRPVTLFDCVRGAQSRIVEFGRVDVHGGQTLYVVAPAVEGLMHAIAELLENATVFSPSRTQVAVSIREVAAGAVVEIDDAGLGMPPDVLEQAVAQLRDSLDLAELGAVPRLGLACVGRWSRELGFSVELSTASAYGGTRVVVFVPHRLLGGGAEPVVDTEPVVIEPVTAPAAPAPIGADSGPGPDSGAGAGLPQRRNRRRTNQKAPDAKAPAPTCDPWTPEAARASIASIVSGTRRGRAEVAEADQADQQDRADREGGR